MKKKVIVVLTAMLMIMALFTGCNSSKKEDLIKAVDEALQGEWTVDVNENGQSVYNFDNGQVSLQAIVIGLALEPNVGTYEIDESYINVTLENGVEQNLPYTYEDGQLSIVNESDQPLYR